MTAPRPIFGHWIEAVAPEGEASKELRQKLKKADRSKVEGLCLAHARERAQEICFISKDEDLIYRDGNSWWSIYNTEIELELKRKLGNNRSLIWTIMLKSERAFIAEVDEIRDRRNVRQGEWLS